MAPAILTAQTPSVSTLLHKTPDSPLAHTNPSTPDRLVSIPLYPAWTRVLRSVPAHKATLQERGDFLGILAAVVTSAACSQRLFLPPLFLRLSPPLSRSLFPLQEEKSALTRPQPWNTDFLSPEQRQTASFDRCCPRHSGSTARPLRVQKNKLRESVGFFLLSKLSTARATEAWRKHLQRF